MLLLFELQQHCAKLQVRAVRGDPASGTIITTAKAPRDREAHATICGMVRRRWLSLAATIDCIKNFFTAASAASLQQKLSFRLWSTGRRWVTFPPRAFA
jgi:hypothetical protein